MTKITKKIGKDKESVTTAKHGKPMSGPVENKMQDSIIGAMKGAVLHIHHPCQPAVESADWNATETEA